MTLFFSCVLISSFEWVRFCHREEKLAGYGDIGFTHFGLRVHIRAATLLPTIARFNEIKVDLETVFFFGAEKVTSLNPQLLTYMFDVP